MIQQIQWSSLLSFPRFEFKAFLIWRRYWFMSGNGFKAQRGWGAIESLILFSVLAIGLEPLVVNVNGVPYIDFIGPAFCLSVSALLSFLESSYGSRLRLNQPGGFHSAFLSPVSLSNLSQGELLWGGFKGFFSGSIILFAYNFMSPQSGQFWIAMLGSLVYISIVSSAVGLIWATFQSKRGEFGLLHLLFVFPGFLIGGLFFPVQALPPGLQWFAQANPFYWLNEFSRKSEVFFAPLGIEYFAQSAWWAAGLLLSFVLLWNGSTLLFRRRLEEVRDRW